MPSKTPFHSLEYLIGLDPKVNPRFGYLESLVKHNFNQAEQIASLEAFITANSSYSPDTLPNSLSSLGVVDVVATATDNEWKIDRAFSSLQDGVKFTCRWPETNTSNVTIQVGDLTSVAIFWRGEAILGGTLIGGESDEIIYDASNNIFQMVGGMRQGLITEDLTLTCGDVNSDFLTFNAALSYLLNFAIGQGKLITLKHQPGLFNYSETIFCNHPQGRQIILEGANELDGSTTVISIPASSHGIVIDGSIRKLSGFTLRGSLTGSASGIYLLDGGTATANNKENSVIVESFGGNGIILSDGALFDAPFITVRSNLQNGIVCSTGSTLDIQGGVIKSNGQAGLTSTRLCSIDAWGGTKFIDNGTHGAIVSHGSYMYANESISQSNGLWGFYASNRGTIYREGSTVSNNGSGSYTPLIGTLGNNSGLII